IITLNTSLKKGLPKENINKIAGPIMEAWVQELFEDIDIANNNINIINVSMPTRLHMADLIIEFEINGRHVTAYCDVKSTSYDIKKSGKSPNITSFTRIRNAYTHDPDFMFLIISLKHTLTTKVEEGVDIIDGYFNVVDFKIYDLKLISDKDISYNPALGTGQIQIRDIHNIEKVDRSAQEFCTLLDKKYLNSSRRTKDDWLREAKKYKWLKEI